MEEVLGLGYMKRRGAFVSDFEEIGAIPGALLLIPAQEPLPEIIIRKRIDLFSQMGVFYRQHRKY